jgi:hypothetical protein
VAGASEYLSPGHPRTTNSLLLNAQLSMPAVDPACVGPYSLLQTPQHG